MESDDVGAVEPELQLESYENSFPVDTSQMDPEDYMAKSEAIIATANLQQLDNEFRKSTFNDLSSEPQMKYERLGSSFLEIIQKDTVSCLAYNPKFIVIGTHWGMVHLLDISGNEIKRYASHAACVNSICIEEKGDYFASAGDDGKVVLYQLDSQDISVYSFKRAVKTVSLAPDYSKSFKFVAAGMSGELVMNSKGWFGTKGETLAEGDGPIYITSWHGRFIAWCDERGVSLYDTTSKNAIKAVVSPPADSPRIDLYKPRILWISDDKFAVSWTKTVTLVQLNSSYLSGYTFPSSIEVVAEVEVSYFITGIAFHRNQFLLLAFTGEELKDNDSGEIQTSPPPEIRILDSSLTEVVCDSLSLSGYELCQPNDYALVPGDDCFYIVSPKDVIMGKSFESDDKVRWYLEREEYLPAFELVLKEPYSTFDKFEIGEAYLSSLIEQGNFSEAASKLKLIFGENKELWDKWAFIFAERKQLSALLPYIPLKSPTLDQTVYEMVLAYMLKESPESFYNAISSWDSSLYNSEAILELLVDETEKDSVDVFVLEAAATLYLRKNDIESALDCYLRIGKDDALEFISSYNLYSSVSKHLEYLLQFDENRKSRSLKPIVFDFLAKNVEQIPVSNIVDELKGKPRKLHEYLDTVFRKDPRLTSDYHSLQLELYADYEPEKLMNFLRGGSTYSLERAAKVCQDRGLVREHVYLLGKMGNNKVAMKIILLQLKDYRMAIDFAKEQNDPEIWEDLVQESFKSPSLTQNLLMFAASEVDPVSLLERMPENQPLSLFKDALLQILSDYVLQLSLYEGCRRIFLHDEFNLLQQIVSSSKRCLKLSFNSTCTVCSQRLIDITLNDPDKEESIVLFYCLHCFHEKCMSFTENSKVCGACSSVTSN